MVPSLGVWSQEASQHTAPHTPTTSASTRVTSRLGWLDIRAQHHVSRVTIMPGPRVTRPSRAIIPATISSLEHFTLKWSSDRTMLSSLEWKDACAVDIVEIIVMIMKFG